MVRRKSSNAFNRNGYDAKELARLYYTPNLASSFGGIRRINSKVKRLNLSNQKDVEQWLSSQNAYTLHRPAVTKFKRRRTIVSGMNQQLQVDLIDVRKYAADNDGINYILTGIDVFSKRAWAIPIKNKTSAEILAALENILDEVEFRVVQSDKGKEFLNWTVQNFFSKLLIRFS